ncbi:MAG: peptidoglycan DD-metalloendopeptidase family protein [Bacteroidales bacterium]|nr:peptidoglycan DD-metalloendopeptidase family protein [Bacteroidales bacterium]
MINKVFHINRILLILSLCLVFPKFSIGQVEDKAQLEKNKAKIEQEIKLTSQLLDQTRKSRKNSLNELILINRKIEQRESLINALESEIYYLDFSIKYNKERIQELENQVSELKEEYSRLIYNTYKNRNSFSRLMFIFSSKDFNQAYQRLKYLQQYTSFRKKQAVMIVNIQDSISIKNLELEQQKKKKISTKKDKVNESRKLAGEKKEKNTAVNQLASKEKSLKSELRKKEKAAQKFQKAIEAIIAEEMRKSQAAKKGSVKSGESYALTPEQLKLSNNFAANKGKLPWPTRTGIVSSRFGERPHPVLKYIKVNNNGIDIQTSQGSEVRAVFDGEITNVMLIPNYNNVIFVRHGEYMSVYSKIEKVYVKKGDKIKTKQSLGSIFTDPNENKTELHFEIWKGKNKQNPEYWITK